MKTEHQIREKENGRSGYRTSLKSQHQKDKYTIRNWTSTTPAAPEEERTYKKAEEAEKAQQEEI